MSNTVVYEIRHRFLVGIGTDIQHLAGISPDREVFTRWDFHKGYRHAAEAISEANRLAATGYQARVVDRGRS